ncbi:hypothetical protein [Streptomyces sp. SCL15-6]|uniref:hypothetical protein n=1 Tax=Streptomyces sp. SCL15-6 TaxID=2967222 RepID=UPI002966EA3B|nr:hypothetical protein [Streptomyces sp. SCL15-6]
MAALPRGLAGSGRLGGGAGELVGQHRQAMLFVLLGKRLKEPAGQQQPPAGEPEQVKSTV